ncbi:MAG: CPBP family intramembrane glutamic endopeptidase [Planctomycetota bacterium]
MARNSASNHSFLDKYRDETATHAYSLVLVLPLILIYEAGILMVSEYSWHDTTVLANEAIVLLFDRLGLAQANLVPAFLVMATLFGLQFATAKPWRIRFGNIPLLHLEYALYAFILFIGVVWMFPGALVYRSPEPIDALLSIGAGIYEEFIFRLVLLSLCMALLEKGLKVEKMRGLGTSVVVTALCFAGFHYILGGDPFRWGDFWVRVAAGIYFGIICLTRGYGLAAGTHAGFNLLIVAFTRAGIPS